MNKIEKGGYGIPREAHKPGKYYGYTLAFILIAGALVSGMTI